MDMIFLEGVGAVLSGVIVFCGSVFLLIALVTGARIAYFVTACVTLAFCTMMAFVWSGFNPPWVPPTVNPLGPVGQLPSWSEIGIGEDVGDIDFEEAGSYPDDPWFAADLEDPLESAQASTLKNEATNVLEEHIKAGDFNEYTAVGDLLADDDTLRLLEQGGTVDGAVTFSPIEEDEGPDIIVMMEYDPGDPLKPARLMTAGFFIVFLLHLFGLWLMERKARRVVIVEETEVERK
jgi:hypothetical protein